MRLMKRDTRLYTLKRRTQQASRYIGSDAVYTGVGQISAVIAPVSDKAVSERFGLESEIIYTAVLDLGTDIRKTDRLVVNGEECTVVQVLAYSSHKTAYLSKKGVM